MIPNAHLSRIALKDILEKAFGFTCFITEFPDEYAAAYMIEVPLKDIIISITYYVDSKSPDFPYFTLYSSGKVFALQLNKPLEIPIFSKSDIPREWIKVLWMGLHKMDMLDFMSKLELEFSITGHEKMEWFQNEI